MRHKTTERWQQPRRGISSPFKFEQIDGSAPRTAIAIDAPGEMGLCMSSHAFSGGARISAVPADHLIVVQPSRVSRMRCRIADDKLEHSSRAWNVTICPAGASAEATCDEDVEIVVLSLPAETVAFAALEAHGRSFVLDPLLHGHDLRLERFVLNAFRGASSGDVADPLWWDQATDVLVHHLLDGYASASPCASGKLNSAQLRRGRDYVRANFCKPLTVDRLGRLRQTKRTGSTSNQRLVHLSVLQLLSDRSQCC